MYIGHNAIYFEDDGTPREIESAPWVLLGTEIMGSFSSLRYFGTMMRSMVSLLQLLTQDSWILLIRPVIEGPQPHFVFFFLFFYVVGTMGMVNLISAVLINNVLTLAKAQDDEEVRKAKLEEDKVLHILCRIFSMIDEDNNGCCTVKELIEFLKHTSAADLMFDGSPGPLTVDEVPAL